MSARTPTPAGSRFIADDDVNYPYSDGKPLGESQPHLLAIRRILDAIDFMLRELPDIAVHGDMFWYWEEGNSSAVRAPDCMVIHGVPMDQTRLSFKSWQHGGIVPSLIIEAASQDQQEILLGDLKDDYEREGVKEYFIFDCSGKYLDQPLQGFRLRAGQYRPIPTDADGTLLSKVLNARLREEGEMLRFSRADTGELIRTQWERDSANAEAIAARDAAAAAREAEMERISAEKERLRMEKAAAEDALQKERAEKAALEQKLREALLRAGIPPGGVQ